MSVPNDNTNQIGWLSAIYTVLGNVLTAMGNVGVSRYPSTSFYKPLQVNVPLGIIDLKDTITNVVVLDVTTSATISSVWRNKSTNTDLTGTPVIGVDVTYTTGDQLTDPQLRASPVPVSIDQTTPGTTESVTVKSSGGMGQVIGAQADAAATTDTGTFSLMALIKRGLERWTTLFTILPSALISSRFAVDSMARGVISTNIATTTPLAGGATYTAAGWDEVTDFQAQLVSVVTDQSGSLNLQYSHDGVAIDGVQSYTITPTTPGTAQQFIFQAMKEARYFRVAYVNGATIQGVFKIQCIHSQEPGIGEVQALDQALITNTDALVTKGVIWGKTTGGGGGYVQVKVNPSGALTADVSNSTGVGVTGTFWQTIQPVSIDQTTPGTTDSVTVKASEVHIGEVGTNGAIVGVELTRPADNTAYAINDAVSNSTSAPTVLTFNNIARANARSGYIIKARLMTDQKTNVAQFRLHLFHTAPTAINDNTAYSVLYANKDKAVGYIDFTAMSTEDSGASDAAFSLWTGQIHFVCASASRTLYGLLETKTAFTPASGQKFYIELSADNN